MHVNYRRVRRAGSPQGTEGLQRRDHEQSESVAVAGVPCDTAGHPPNRRRLRAAVLLHADSASLCRARSGALSAARRQGGRQRSSAGLLLGVASSRVDELRRREGAPGRRRSREGE